MVALVLRIDDGDVVLRRASAAIIALVGVTGCQKLFDVSGGHTGDGGMGGDAPIGTAVTGTYGFTDVVNGSDNVPKASAGMYSGLTATVMLDDGATPPVATVAGTFQFEVEHPGQRYVVSLSTDSFTERIDSTAAQLTLSDHLYGRLDRDPVPNGTELEFTDQGLASGTAYPTVYTTGLWGQTTLPPFASIWGTMEAAMEPAPPTG